MKSLLAAGVALAALTTAAMAEPVHLSSQQMDGVTAGAISLELFAVAAAQSTANPYTAFTLVGGTSDVNADVKSKTVTGVAAGWAVCSGLACGTAAGVSGVLNGNTADPYVTAGGNVINIPGVVPVTVRYAYVGVAAR
jgi:hypothetical protein